MISRQRPDAGKRPDEVRAVEFKPPAAQHRNTHDTAITSGRSAASDCLPRTWPPASQPCAMRRWAPASCAVCASSAEPIWHSTVTPASRSLRTMSGAKSQNSVAAAICCLKACRQLVLEQAGGRWPAGMRLTPNARSLRACAYGCDFARDQFRGFRAPCRGSRNSPRRYWTAATSSARAGPPMPANTMGTSQPRMLHALVCSLLMRRSQKMCRLQILEHDLRHPGSCWIFFRRCPAARSPFPRCTHCPVICPATCVLPAGVLSLSA